MIASDVMTRNVISVPPDATVAQAVELMLERGISGLLVVDASGTLAGIVTEGDLLRRDELGTQRRRSWWLRLIASPGRQAADFTRTHGRRVADVMTHDVDQRRCRCSSRGDRRADGGASHQARAGAGARSHRGRGEPSGFAARAGGGSARTSGPAADDRTIRDRILKTLSREPWAPRTTLNVTVVNGVVDLWGTISNDQERRAICVIAENAPGAKKVIDHLVFVEAYTGTVIEPPPAG